MGGLKSYNTLNERHRIIRLCMGGTEIKVLYGKYPGFIQENIKHIP